jgi:hypothetical protein
VTSSDEAKTAPGTRRRPGVNAGPDALKIPVQRCARTRLPATPRPGDEDEDLAWLRNLARRGELGLAIADGHGKRLRRAAWAIAYQIVFDVITRRLELTRGHGRCARGVLYLTGSCLDGFYDDVESVIDYLLAAAKPIDDLEGWLAHWGPKAAVDGHRRRRGERGALQRPRMTLALAEGLRNDPWLRELALKILVWVGVPTSAGAGLWPLETWAHNRAVQTGDYAGSTLARVAAEVEQVLEVMRRRPDWYQAHVERPLGHKIAPVAAPPGDGLTDPRPLLAATPAEVEDTHVRGLAWTAVEAIRAGINHHHDPTETVVEVLTRLFLGGTAAEEIDRTPAGTSGSDQRLSALLADPAALAGLVEQVLDVVRDEPAR